jgi:hypothetical protein
MTNPNTTAERFTINKSESGKWIVTDAKSDPAEDAVIYRFPSRAKAQAFVAMLAAEAK